MIVLDTNVVSELTKAAPDKSVVSWVDRQSRTELFVTSITQAELLYGVALLPEGRRRISLTLALDTAFAELFRDRVLPFDSAAASAFAVIVIRRRRSGRPISGFDA
jgi:predicted nucleic acid-binding protein